MGLANITPMPMKTKMSVKTKMCKLFWEVQNFTSSAMKKQTLTADIFCGIAAQNIFGKFKIPAMESYYHRFSGSCIFTEKVLQSRCFLLNFRKFFRKIFFIEHLWLITDDSCSLTIQSIETVVNLGKCFNIWYLLAALFLFVSNNVFRTLAKVTGQPEFTCLYC